MKLLLLTLLLNPAFAEFKIALIDGGVDRTASNIKICSDSKDFVPRSYAEKTVEHGTVMASIISEGLTDYCIMDLKIFNDVESSANLTAEAVNYALDHGAVIINASIQGRGKYSKEKAAFERASKKRVTSVVAAGNFGIDLSKQCDTFPACYNTKNMLVVEDSCYANTNYGGPVKLKICSNYIYKNVVWQGTSVSTARVTHNIMVGAVKLRKQKEKEKKKQVGKEEKVRVELHAE